MGSYLIDTNTVIDLLGGLLPPHVISWLDSPILAKDIHVSVINEIELLGFNSSPQETQDLQDLINNATVLELKRDIVNRTILLKKIKRIKLPDAIIAATALVHNLTIISRNTSDFKNITGLTCLDPYTDI
jgi:predicted nucleic acid-binding protein